MSNRTDEHEEDIRIIYRIVDKLEKRIATLEKVLDSHAKCIGELRGTELRIHNLKNLKDLSELTPDEFAKQVKFKWTLDHGTGIV